MNWRKQGGAKKRITCLLAEDGTPLTEPAEMCGRARAFYASLFSPDPTDPSACRVLWEELPTVSTSDRDRLELPLTLAEFSEALHHMPTNKSPGMDGLTVEFYRMFWDILGPDLVTVWAESLQSGVLSCRRTVLTLLPKKGDLRDLRNWRPVSLLSTDYKIVAKAISLRLGSVLADVIHSDQTYTVPDRSIFDNLFQVQDLLELGRRDSLSFALLSLDQEKAFDRVDHGYLLSTLQAFGFGPQFVGFPRVLYASVECLVKLNWTLTEPVSFGRLTGLVLRELELQLVLLSYPDDMLLMIQDPGNLARVRLARPSIQQPPPPGNLHNREISSEFSHSKTNPEESWKGKLLTLGFAVSSLVWKGFHLPGSVKQQKLCHELKTLKKQHLPVTNKKFQNP
ncbi:unnamed protein product [Caretta caretta]